MDVTRSFGETEKLLTNVFELCGEVRAPSSMQQVAQSREWLTWSDQITSFVGQTQNYRLEGEKAFTIAALHLLLAQNGTIINNLKSQNVAWEKRGEMSKNNNLIKAVREGMRSGMRNAFEGNALVVQMPIILDLIQPNIRSVNPSLLSKAEKKALGMSI